MAKFDDPIISAERLQKACDDLTNPADIAMVTEYLVELREHAKFRVETDTPVMLWPDHAGTDEPEMRPGLIL